MMVVLLTSLREEMVKRYKVDFIILAVVISDIIDLVDVNRLITKVVDSREVKSD